MEYQLTPDSTVSTGLMNPAEDKVVPWAPGPEYVSTLEPLVPPCALSGQIAPRWPRLHPTVKLPGLERWLGYQGPFLSSCCISCRGTAAGTPTASKLCTSSAPQWTPQCLWMALSQSAMLWSFTPSVETSLWSLGLQTPYSDLLLLRNKMTNRLQTLNGLWLSGEGRPRNLSPCIHKYLGICTVSGMTA